MLVSMIESMKIAREKGYCVPAMTVANEHMLRALIAGAEAKKSPLILLYMYGNNPDIKYFGRIIRDLATQASVPVSIVLDHGEKYEHAIDAIAAGFTDIMVDRSSLPYEENVAQVKELVKIAHAIGVGVEAELGHVGMGGDMSQNVFTVPSEAKQFVEETGVDALAVAIGTSHGKYKGEPKLQFDLLEELRETVSVPLVLHGGSGTGDENLSKAAKLGICKLNIAFEFYRSALDVVQSEEFKNTPYAEYGMYGFMAKAMQETAEHVIDVCGSAGKAE
ncbi:MAG: class II fructose-bisphosphate aldolase [Lachnospiraceae bacterium]|nr:class II fructose-bisphosphate aldolase [Lachnospiraceae bacterium]